MRRFSAASHFRVFFSAACLAAHSSHESGFRQRDVKFYIGLFSNWMDAVMSEGSVTPFNMQIARYLNDITEEGFARELKGKRYRLTRSGIVQLFTEIVAGPHLPFERFFFVRFVVQTYGEIISQMAEREGAQFPRAMKLELDALRDPKQLLTTQLRYLDREIERLEIRIQDAFAAAETSKDLHRKGMSTDQVVREIQRRFPYELNNQKTLEQLMAELPQDVRCFELEQGAVQRAAILWKPMLQYLIRYRDDLRS